MRKVELSAVTPQITQRENNSEHTKYVRFTVSVLVLYTYPPKKHSHLLAAAILINRKFENYRETSHNPDAVIGFYDAKQLFYDHSMEKMYVL